MTEAQLPTDAKVLGDQEVERREGPGGHVPEGLEPASAGPQQGLASASSSLANLPSRTRLLTNYWKSNRMPVTYLPVHDTTPAVTVTSCDADSFARLVKRVTGTASAPSRGNAKRAGESAPGGGPPAKKGAAARVGAGAAPAAAATAQGARAAAGAQARPLSAAGPSAAAAGPPAPGAAAGAAPRGTSASASGSGQPRPAPPAAAAALAAAVSQQGGDAGAGGPRRSFSQEELKAKSVRDLKELCKARSLPISGTKDQLMSRIIEHQRKMKRPFQQS